LLAAARTAGMLVIHTREDHYPDLTDATPAKLARNPLSCGLGNAGPIGWVLIRGEYGYLVIPELYPLSIKPFVDKSGKDAVYEVDLALILANRGIKSLIGCGMTPRVCVGSIVREVSDQGYECLAPEDDGSSYFPKLHRIGLATITTRGYFRLGLELEPSG
jgi:nicotinamidase-related amidase